MIWSGGEILEDLRISVRDRTFEHGLGLFETFRTWNGRPVLLRRHLHRLTRSAFALGLKVDEATLPDASAVIHLIAAEGLPDDALVRITVSGGEGPSGRSAVWMTAANLPPPILAARCRLERHAEGDLDAYKSLNYWSRREAFCRARRADCDETIFCSDDGRVREGSRTNLFAVINGLILTPPLAEAHPIVPGVMRYLVCELVKSLGMEAGTALIYRGDFPRIEELFLTNSVRGIIPVSAVENNRYTAPGPRTSALMSALRARLESGEIDR